MKVRTTILSLAALALAACGSEDHVNIFHATFVANDVRYDWTTAQGFTTLADNYQISYFKTRNDWAGPWLILTVPINASSGLTCKDQESSNCFIVMRGPDGLNYDSRAYGSTLSMTVTKWGGVGQYAYGTFSGTFKDDSVQNTLVVQNGAFEGFIHN